MDSVPARRSAKGVSWKTASVVKTDKIRSSWPFDQAPANVSARSRASVLDSVGSTGLDMPQNTPLERRQTLVYFQPPFPGRTSTLDIAKLDYDALRMGSQGSHNGRLSLQEAP